MKVKIDTAMTPGRASGRTTCSTARGRPAPSTRAASSSSSGMLWKNARSIQAPRVAPWSPSLGSAVPQAEIHRLHLFVVQDGPARTREADPAVIDDVMPVAHLERQADVLLGEHHGDAGRLDALERQGGRRHRGARRAE